MRHTQGIQVDVNQCLHSCPTPQASAIYLLVGTTCRSTVFAKSHRGIHLLDKLLIGLVFFSSPYLKVSFKPFILLNNLLNAVLIEVIHFSWNADDVCRTNIPARKWIKDTHVKICFQTNTMYIQLLLSCLKGEQWSLMVNHCLSVG